MTISPQEFRDVLCCFASGVTLVTSKAGAETRGLTVSAFASISADPPLVAVAIDQAHAINPLLHGSEACFAVNILAEDQSELSDRFAFIRDEDRFLVGEWHAAITGAPVLRDALAWLDCIVVNRYRAGTHTVYLGSVEASAVPRPDDRPLVYWDREYRRL